jgi:hypothetical protein
MIFLSQINNIIERPLAMNVQLTMNPKAADFKFVDFR